MLFHFLLMMAISEEILVHPMPPLATVLSLCLSPPLSGQNLALKLDKVNAGVFSTTK